MNKEEFLNSLRKRLKGLPNNEIEERISFYSEMIDDRLEEGMSEEEAIESLGGIDNVVRQIASESNLFSIVKEKIKPNKSPNALLIVLLVLGFPLWFPLLLTGIILLLVAYLLLWVLVIVTYSVEIFSVGFSFIMILKMMNDGFNIGYAGILMLSIGLSLSFLYVCYLATKVSFKITKSILLSIKTKLIGGRE